MDFLQDFFDKAKFLALIFSGVLFALTGVFAIIRSGEDFTSLILGAVFFLIGAAVMIFSEKIHGNI